MTREKDEVTVVEKLIVAFDICSSSNIIEELTLIDNVKAMRDTLIQTKKFLRRKSKKLGFIRYKFTGDGWILLFPIDISGAKLMSFLTQLSNLFKTELRNRVLSVMEIIPDITGLTFGLERGRLVKFFIDEKTEYIGRPLNIACRLQNAIGQNDPTPQYKVLMSKNVFNAFSDDLVGYTAFKVTRSLRNIRDGKRFPCIKLHLPIIKRKKIKKKKKKKPLPR